MPNQFIGAAGTFTEEQRQIDIEFFDPQPVPTCRLVHLFLGYGVGFMFIEREHVANQGALRIPGTAVGRIRVFDMGHSGAPETPLQLVGAFVVLENGVQIQPSGYPILFGRRLKVVRPGNPVDPWHFRYEPRFHRSSPDEEMGAPGAGIARNFMDLLYGGQVQNWRKIVW